MSTPTASKSSANINKLYREFSKQKFNSLRLKFPKLKQSEITKKVLKEWEELGEKEKIGLEEAYQKKGVAQEEQVKAALKRGKKKDRDEGIVVAGEQVVVVGKIAAGVVLEESSGDQPEVKSQKASESGGSSGSNLSKTKGIRKIKANLRHLSNGQYLQFYQFYFERLTKQHPKWTSQQRSTIIKLMWKKRQTQKKKQTLAQRFVKVSARRVKKPVLLTGYKYFAQHKLDAHPDVDPGIVKKQAIQAWKKLNRAGKYFYEKKAKQHNATILPESEDVQKKPKKIIQLTALLNLTI